MFSFDKNTIFKVYKKDPKFTNGKVHRAIVNNLLKKKGVTNGTVKTVHSLELIKYIWDYQRSSFDKDTSIWSQMTILLIKIPYKIVIKLNIKNKKSSYKGFKRSKKMESVIQ